MKKLMLAVGVTTATLLAGCTGSATDAGSSSGPPPTPASSSATTTPSATPTPTPAPTPTGPVELTIEEAGQRYLEAVCPSNAAEDKYTAVYEKYDPYASEELVPNAKTQKAARAAADADAAAALALMDPSVVWPQSVRADVEDVATALYEKSAWFDSIAEAELWGDVSSYPKVKNKNAPSAVRLALGLPPRGECPKDLS